MKINRCRRKRKVSRQGACSHLVAVLISAESVLGSGDKSRGVSMAASRVSLFLPLLFFSPLSALPTIATALRESVCIYMPGMNMNMTSGFQGGGKLVIQLKHAWGWIGVDGSPAAFSRRSHASSYAGIIRRYHKTTALHCTVKRHDTA